MELKTSVVVFDLDDTLFKEDSYHLSGVNYVCEQIKYLYGKDIKSELMEIRKGNTDLWGYACQALNLPESTKESLLWMYRLHSPRIELDKATREQLENLGDKAVATIILTDGRSISQRQKLLSLGLLDLPIYISEEWNSAKPEQHRFEVIMDTFPTESYVYIGDNVAKDFIAPNALNWTTIGLIDNGLNIHSQNKNMRSGDVAPTFWIEKISDLSHHFH